jgi:hypothetical protein
MEPWRAVDAHNGGLEAQNGALEGLLTSFCRFASLRRGPMIQIRIKERRLIRIRIRVKVMRIRNPGP